MEFVFTLGRSRKNREREMKRSLDSAGSQTSILHLLNTRYSHYGDRAAPSMPMLLVSRNTISPVQRPLSFTGPINMSVSFAIVLCVARKHLQNAMKSQQLALEAAN